MTATVRPEMFCGSFLGCSLARHAGGPGFHPLVGREGKICYGTQSKKNDWPVLESPDNSVCIKFEAFLESGI